MKRTKKIIEKHFITRAVRLSHWRPLQLISYNVK